MTSVDQLLKPDPPRDRYGRYLLRLPGDTKPRGRTRVTTFIKALDQGDGLIAWKATATMVGALRNPGLHAKWASIFAQSQDPWYHSDDLKARCKKLVDECADHGGAQSRADHGTALHSMLELVARGETPNLVDPYKADIEAFKQTLAAVPLVPHPDWTEVCVYIPEYDLVGTFDGFFYGEHGPLILGDYKTVNSTDYKSLSMAAQLAAYSLATHRIIFPPNPDDTATLQPLPDFDHDTGLIIHLPAGQAQCTLHAVDLNQGREALELAHKMRRLDAQRKRKDTGGLMRPWTTEAPCVSAPTPKTASKTTNEHGSTSPSTPTNDPSTDLPNPSVTLSMSTSGGSSTPTETHILPAASSSSPPTEQALKSRLQAIAQHQPDLAQIITRRWPPGVPAIKDEWYAGHVVLVHLLLEELDIEGPMAEEADVQRISGLFLRLPNTSAERIQQWVIEAASDPNRYRPLALGAGNHTTRRITLAETCLLIAGNDIDDATFYQLMVEVMTNSTHRNDEITGLGQALGLMNWHQAQTLLALTRLHTNLQATITESEPSDH